MTYHLYILIIQILYIAIIFCVHTVHILNIYTLIRILIYTLYKNHIGILSKLFRDLNAPLPQGKENEMRWIVFDGDVDAL